MTDTVQAMVGRLTASKRWQRLLSATQTKMTWTVDNSPREAAALLLSLQAENERLRKIRIVPGRGDKGWAYAFGTEYPRDGYAAPQDALNAARESAREQG